jgi:hypothetical protein
LSSDTETSRFSPCNEEEEFMNLPGAELVLPGLRELRDGRPGECGLLVLIASPRLTRLGVAVPIPDNIPLPYEHQLYSLLEETRADDAYSYYNSLLRRMASFAGALEHIVSQSQRESSSP